MNEDTMTTSKMKFCAGDYTDYDIHLHDNAPDNLTLLMHIGGLIRIRANLFPASFQGMVVLAPSGSTAAWDEERAEFRADVAGDYVFVISAIANGGEERRDATFELHVFKPMHTTVNLCARHS